MTAGTSPEEERRRLEAFHGFGEGSGLPPARVVRQYPYWDWYLDPEEPLPRSPGPLLPVRPLSSMCGCGHRGSGHRDEPVGGRRCLFCRCEGFDSEGGDDDSDGR